jgi:hypothetical protein
MQTKKTAVRQFHWIATLALMCFLTMAEAPEGWAKGQTVTVAPTQNLQALVNRYPAGTTFSLAPGIHRDSVVPKAYDSFVGQSGAIMSGAVLLSSFSPSGPYWRASVQVKQAASYRGNGHCQTGHDACAYPEDLFFDNVVKLRELQLEYVGPGSWYLDYSTGTVYMGDNPNGHTVELGVRPYAFSGPEPSVMIQNLIIEKYACTAGSGAVEGGAGSNGWVVEDNEIKWNHGAGIDDGDGMRIEGNKVHDNGQLGMGGGGSNVLVQHNQLYSNNDVGYSYDWEAGGTKFTNGENLVFQYNYSHDNNGAGFHTDVNLHDSIIRWNRFTNNKEAAMVIEISSNIAVYGNNIWNDGYNPAGPELWWGGAIEVNDSTYVSVYSNVITNCMNGIGGIFSAHGNGPDGQPYTLQHLNVNGNTITQPTGFAAGIVLEDEYDNRAYTIWHNTFSGNTYILGNPDGNDFYWSNGPTTMANFVGPAAGQ